MNNLRRRELCGMLAALAATPGALAQETTAPAGGAEQSLSRSEVFRFNDLPVHPMANGGEMRPVVQGVLTTGEAIEVHETTLMPGKMPHPAHRHRHSELLLLREGTLETTNDGVPARTGPGGVILTASGVLHSLKNVGDVPAKYFVVAIGRATGVTPVTR